MKKLIVLLTLILYIASTNGMVRSVHFCMNEASGTELSLSEVVQSNCPLCGMEEKQKGCCSHEQSVVKLDSNHQSSEIAFEIPVFILLSLETAQFDRNPKRTAGAKFTIAFLDEHSSIPIYIRDSSYLI